MAPIKVGIIGYGKSTTTFHLPLLLSLPEQYKVTHLLSRRELSLDDPTVKILSSSEQFFASDIDLVIITTENKTHFSYARDALKAGKNVVVEKPFTATLEEGQELVDLAKQTGLILSVFQNRRWDADFLTLKKLIKENTLGRVVNVYSRYDRYRPAGKGGWRETDPVSGGILFDLGAHVVDQALALFGTPKNVYAVVSNQRQLAEVTTDDFFELHFRYDDVLVTLSGGMLVRTPSPRFVVHGTKGSWTKPGVDIQEPQLIAGLTPLNAPQDFGVELKENWGYLETTTPDGTEEKGHKKGENGRYLGFYENIFQAVTAKDASLLEVKPEQALQTMKILSQAKKYGSSSGNGIIPIESIQA